MRLHSLWTPALLALALGFAALAQSPETKEAPATDMKGLPPRAAPSDYPSQAKAGSVTIAAEFTGHSVARPEGPLNTEDYVVVEACFYGDPGQRLQLSIDNFTLRINGKKAALPSQPFGLVAHTLKDPSYSPPEEEEAKKSKSSGGLSTGGAKNDNSSLPVIVHIPIEMQRAMSKYIEKSSLPEGDRPLPQAGLLFFQFHGKTSGLRSLELIYSGPAGKATLALQP